MAIKEDDVVLCTVKKIEGTTVFVSIEGEEEGNIVMSEIAAGRIRNLREYVAPNKRIVCKVLRILNGHPQLSLRRVTAKERQQVLDHNKKEKTLQSMLKTIIKDPKSVIEKIKKEYEIPDFLDEARETPKIIEKFLSKKESEALSKILKEKGEKEKVVKKTFTLRSDSASGLSEIKEILKIKEVKILYLGSSKFSISVSGKNFKEANKKLEESLEELEKKAKQKKAELKIRERKK